LDTSHQKSAINRVLNQTMKQKNNHLNQNRRKALVIETLIWCN